MEDGRLRAAGRPRIVGRDEALERAKDLFWSLGYQRASLPELEKATGLQRGSLYALFTDKRTLFLEALDLYGREALATMEAQMPRGAKRADIIAWAKLHAARAHGADGRRGCFLIETTVEMGPHDPVIAAKAAEIFSAMLDRLERALTRAPDITVHHAGGAARALLAGLEGLRVFGKAGQSERQVMHAVDSLVTTLLSAGLPRAT